MDSHEFFLDFVQILHTETIENNNTETSKYQNNGVDCNKINSICSQIFYG